MSLHRQLRTICGHCNRICLTAVNVSTGGTRPSTCITHSRQYSVTQNLLGTSINQFKSKQVALAKASQKNAKYARLAMGAVNAGGGSKDPSVNKVLAELISKCQKDGVPKSVILNTISTKNLSNDFTLFLTGPGDFAAIVSCRASGLQHARNSMSGAIRRSMFGTVMVDPSKVGQYFERKGVIIVEQPFQDGSSLDEDESMELALDVEAEEVSQTDDGLKFLCDDKAIKDVQKNFEERKIPVAYVSIDHVPISKCQLKKDDFEFYQYFCQLLTKKVSVADNNIDFYNVINNLE